MKHIVIETSEGLKELDAVPDEPPRVTLGPKKAEELPEAPKPKRKVKEVKHGASDQT